jgi:hypothetical protein
MAAHSFDREFEEPEDEPLGEPPAWTESYPAPAGLLVPFRKFDTWAGAELAKRLLEAEGVSCFVLPIDRMAALLGLSFTLYVEARWLHRARFIYEEDSITDAELAFLATGEFAPDE